MLSRPRSCPHALGSCPGAAKACQPEPRATPPLSRSLLYRKTFGIDDPGRETDRVLDFSCPWRHNGSGGIPMSSPGDPSLYHLWQGGDEQAARVLFERYADRLVALARRRLGQRLARRVDAEDVV